MSIQAMTWALKQPIKPAAAKLLLIAIANYANQDGKAWPSKMTLAADCSSNKSDICKRMRQLSDMGLISVKERRVDGASLSSVITLNISAQRGGGIYPTPTVGPNGHKPSLEPYPSKRRVILGDTVEGDVYASGDVCADDEVPA